MSWYFLNPTTQAVFAVTPRVASTSQRRLYERLGYEQLTEEKAASLSADGHTVHGVIRSPLARLISAYQRHKPGFAGVKFDEYTATRATWDSHVMPQTKVHARNGVEVTDWQTFESLVDMDGFPHENATPADFKERNKVLLSEKWLEWYQETYADDIALYNWLSEKPVTAG